MKNKLIVLSLLAFSLCSCTKTSELYKEHAYNSPIFDENYYVEWNGVKDLDIKETKEFTKTVEPQSVTKNIDDNSNLGDIDSSFKYGYLSKLYDGRLRCDGYYQLSRVQLNKTGYATFFPKQLKECTSFGIALRGGSTCATPLSTFIKFNFEISFYIHLSNETQYNKVTYHLNNVPITTDNGGSTQTLSFFTDGQIDGAVAMSLSFEMSEVYHPDITDDMSDKEKEHLAIMLYEVLMPKSTWL